MKIEYKNKKEEPVTLSHVNIGAVVSLADQPQESPENLYILTEDWSESYRSYLIQLTTGKSFFIYDIDTEGRDSSEAIPESTKVYIRDVTLSVED